jgi:hypothetical protein
VAAGDTLQSIAQSVYGNSKLWFIIAQANGLTDPSDLSSIQGQSLTLPARVTGSHNNSSTTKPYDPSAVRGASAPEIPMPSAGSGGGCGGVGKIITIAVAIAVTVATQGATTAMWGNIIGNAAAAAAGSFASQAVGNALGVQRGFSWNAVALSALSAGITRGVVGDPASVAASSSWQTTAVQYAAANALTQSIAVVTGLQKSFDWRGVVASAAGSAVGQLTSGALNQAGAFSSWGDWGGQLARATVSGMAAGTTAAVMRGGRVSVKQVATDAFGNALGGGLGGGYDTQLPTGDFSRMDRANDPYQMGYQSADGSLISDAQQLARVRGGPDMLAAGSSVGGILYDNGTQVGGPQINLPQVDFYDAGTAPEIPVRASRDGSDWLAREARATSNLYANGAGDVREIFSLPEHALQEVTVSEPRMTQAEMDEFDRQNPGVADAARILQYGSISDYQPSVWDRTGLSPDVRQVMSNTITGTVIGSLINTAGSIAASVRSDRYNFATGQYLNPVEQRNALIDNVINLETLPIGMGAAGATRLEMQGGRAVWVQSSEIRQSQKSISFAKRDEFGNIKYTLDDIAQGFRENPADPRMTVNVVRMRDGGLTSLDNSRPAVLNVQGGGDILARIRDYNDPLTPSEVRRFRADRPSGEIRTPSTWGEAADYRIWRQGDKFMTLYPNGTGLVPKIAGAPADSVCSQFNQYPWRR